MRRKNVSVWPRQPSPSVYIQETFRHAIIKACLIGQYAYKPPIPLQCGVWRAGTVWSAGLERISYSLWWPTGPHLTVASGDCQAPSIWYPLRWIKHNARRRRLATATKLGRKVLKLFVLATLTCSLHCQKCLLTWLPLKTTLVPTLHFVILALSNLLNIWH